MLAYLIDYQGAGLPDRQYPGSLPDIQYPGASLLDRQYPGASLPET